MSLFNEIAVRAKSDGWFTQEWAMIRNGIHCDDCFEGMPGASDVQKLQAWAESQGLLMDLDLEFGGFSTDIRTVTFWDGARAVDGGDAGQTGVLGECTVHDAFDWSSVDGAGDGDDEAWAALSRDADCAVIGV